MAATSSFRLEPEIRRDELEETARQCISLIMNRCEQRLRTVGEPSGPEHIALESSAFAAGESIRAFLALDRSLD